jgi:hypothetical protein
VLHQQSAEYQAHDLFLHLPVFFASQHVSF